MSSEWPPAKPVASKTVNRSKRYVQKILWPPFGGQLQSTCLELRYLLDSLVFLFLLFDIGPTYFFVGAYRCHKIPSFPEMHPVVVLARTISSLQSHFVWPKHCMSFMKPPSSWLWAVHRSGGFAIIPETSNFSCPPAKPGVYLKEITHHSDLPLNRLQGFPSHLHNRGTEVSRDAVIGYGIF